MPRARRHVNLDFCVCVCVYGCLYAVCLLCVLCARRASFFSIFVDCLLNSRDRQEVTTKSHNTTPFSLLVLHFVHYKKTYTTKQRTLQNNVHYKITYTTK